ncbi:hypothetical protein PSACC_00119 [Paramicrosporidium saccamoebae]|uniref:Uncharacterized protein n=1 Tax=Paramicrosporidium saccamoebae TaxID=1246581 RepID=A0A2H9TQR0_9FUNG|nr:hypothetical protein PSACC_00119 [Paramicrosporidium saccamoebae]
MQFALGSLLLLLASASANISKSPAAAVHLPSSTKNGHNQLSSKNIITDLELDSGWFKFFFGQSNEETAYTFKFDYDDYVQISITDAYCAGDSFDLYKNGAYLLTTPLVSTNGCKDWTDNPNVAMKNDIFSSSKFSLPGKFNLTIWSKESPYNGGAAFIRADTRLQTCGPSTNMVLVTAPLSTHQQVVATCKRVGGKPVHIDPKNTKEAAKLLMDCGRTESWFGRLSLLPRSKAKGLGCLAFTVAIPDDPTVDVLDCATKLPVLCTLA